MKICYNNTVIKIGQNDTKGGLGNASLPKKYDKKDKRNRKAQIR